MKMMNSSGENIQIAEPKPVDSPIVNSSSPNFQFGDQITILNQMISLITTIQTE